MSRAWIIPIFLAWIIGQVTLKLTGAVDWSWQWTVAPLWIALVTLLLFIMYMAHQDVKHKREQ